MEKSFDCDVSQRPQISVVLLAGLPASGKSTLARKLKERFNPDDNDLGEENITRLIHIEYDNLEDDLLSSIDSEEDDFDNNDDEIEARRRDAWNQARQRAVEKMREEIEKIMIAGSTNNAIILMDDNFHLRGMRKQIHRLLLTRYKPIRFGILYLETPLEVCLERNRKRSGRRKIPSDVIEKMAESLEPPRVAWEVDSTMTIVDSDKRFEEIVEFLSNCPEIVDLPEVDLEQQALDRALTRKNKIHSIDKELRSYVGKVAKFDRSLAKSANHARITVKEDFKAGRIELEGVTRAFLDSIVADSSATSTIRIDLQNVLEG